MLRKLKTLRETITTPLIKGIFFNLASSGEFEFINDDNKKELNVDYYDIYSSEKLASKIFQKVESETDYVIIDNDDLVYIDDYEYVFINLEYDDIYETLSKIIIQRYKDKWIRLYDALKLEYNVIENYNMKQKLTLNTSVDTHTEVNSDMENVNNVNRFGFDDNGEDGSPYEKASSRSKGSYKDNYSDVGTDNTGTEELERTGNIGVTTSQQMLESEIRLRIMNNLTMIIYKDIDSVLTSPIYRN